MRGTQAFTTPVTPTEQISPAGSLVSSPKKRLQMRRLKSSVAAARLEQEVTQTSETNPQEYVTFTTKAQDAYANEPTVDQLNSGQSFADVFRAASRILEDKERRGSVVDRNVISTDED